MNIAKKCQAFAATVGLLAVSCFCLISCEKNNSNPVAKSDSDDEQSSIYIYFGSEIAYYHTDTTSILIKWNEAEAGPGFTSTLKNHPNLGTPYDTNLIQGFAWYPLVGTYSYASLLAGFRRSSAVNQANEVLYQVWRNMGDTTRVYTFVGDEIICQFADTTRSEYITNLFKQYKLEIIETLPWNTNEFILRVQPNCPLTTVDMSNWLAELSETDWAEPNAGGGGILDGTQP